MKLIDIIHESQRKLKQVLLILHYNPFTEQGRRKILQESVQKGRHSIEQIEIPENSPHQENAAGISQPTPEYLSTPSYHNYNPYKEYKCFYNNPLNCPNALQQLEQIPNAKFCTNCSFPLCLREKQQILGKRGVYEIQRYLGKRGMGRLYHGIQKNSDLDVIIKEYLLPARSFTELNNIQQRQETFIKIANFNNINQNDLDSRIILPYEAIVDSESKRCYLISQSNFNAYPTLRVYLEQHAAMSEHQVINILDQILQTLEYLPLKLPQIYSNQVVHGNINLDSLLIIGNQESFYIYLTDLSIWEDLFNPSINELKNASIQNDLNNLAYVACSLIKGKEVTNINQVNLSTIDIRLKEFIEKLLEINSGFATFAIARKHLKNIVLPEKSNLISDNNEISPKSRKIYLSLFAGFTIIGLLGILIYFTLNDKNKPQPTITNPLGLIDNINELPDLNTGHYRYVNQGKNTASSIVSKSGFIEPNINLFSKLSQIKPDIDFQDFLPNINTEGFISIKELEKLLESETIEIAIAISLENDSNNSEFVKKTVAYNGISVFIPNSSEKRYTNLVKPLKGRITLDELRQIYTQEIINWKDLKGPDMPIRLFIPDDPTVVEIFEQLVLQDQQSREKFQSLIANGEIQVLNNTEMLRVIKQNFEKDKNEVTGGIGFDIISYVFLQCSVYPLAIAEANQQAVSILLSSNDNQDITPENINLCNHKGSYEINQQSIRDKTYPLSFNMQIIHLNNNEREKGKNFVGMLKTIEGQCLLTQFNLTPLQPVDCTKYNQ